MSAFQHGRIAHDQGVCRFDNPNVIGSVSWADWRHGWDRAAEQKRINRPVNSAKNGGLSAPQVGRP